MSKIIQAYNNEVLKIYLFKFIRTHNLKYTRVSGFYILMLFTFLIKIHKYFENIYIML